MADIPPSNPKAVERERAAQKKITFAIIENAREDTLVDHRQACSNHSLFEAHQKSEAAGNPMPRAHEECLKVLDVTGRKGLEQHLYINLALQAQGVQEWRNEVHNKLLENGEIGRTHRAIGRAAMAGEPHYQTVNPEVKRDVTCPLALDAGFTYGAANGSAPMQVLTPKTRQAVVEACYNPKSPPTINVDGTVMPLSKAGLLAGENIGRALRKELDAKPQGSAPVAPLPTPRGSQQPAASRAANDR